MGKGGKAFSQRGKGRNRRVEAASSPAVKTQAMRHALLLAAVIGFTFCAYSNSFNAPFLLDNDPMILQDNRIRAVTSDHIHRILTQQYWATHITSLYRPLTTLSYLFNYAVLGNGTNPAGYHWLNFILHAANIGLVYWLGLVIFEQVPAALLLSAVWGLHPVLTESVTNIVGRADLLAAFGLLAALYFHRKAQRTSGGWKALWLAGIVLAVTAGIFSKESAVVVVAAMALHDLTFGRAGSWRSRIPSYIAVAVPCLVFLYVRAHVLANAAYAPFPYCDNPLTGAGFWTARATAVKVIGKYFLLLLWPAQLSIDYSYNQVPLSGWGMTNGEDWKAAAALIACVAVAVVAIRSFRRHKPLFFSIAFFFVTLLPTSNLLILIGSIMAERFLYIPSIGFWAAVVYGLYAVWQRLPASQTRIYAAGAAVSAILMAFAVRTYDRNSDWLDQQAFWRSALEAAPGSYRVQLGAATGAVPLAGKDWDRSIGEVDRALTILDSLPDVQSSGTAYRQAGIVYRTFGEWLSRNAAGASAEPWYRKSLNALLRSEKIELAQDAENRRENTRRGKPGLTFVPGALYLEMGRTYMRLSDPPDGLAAFERGRMLESDPDLLEEAAAAYRATGDLRKAALALVEAVAMDSGRVHLTSQLVELYAQIDPAGCAVSRQGGTPSLNVDCPLVHGDICTASRNVTLSYLRKGQHLEADAIRRTAVEDLGCAPELLN